MKNIVISQPMFFPWIGLFEQIRLADVFVHFNDVQLPQGRSFTNRVQIKTKDGSKWLTVPLKKAHASTKIKDVLISYDEDWRNDHLKFLESNYSKAPYKKDMLDIVRKTYDKTFSFISELNIFGIELVCEYFGFKKQTLFLTSDQYDLNSQKSERLMDIIKNFEATKYITGWGALNYLDYNLFEKNNIEVEYLDYKKKPYSQSFGDFNPFVSILDLIAYEGKNGINYIHSSSLPWKNFINDSN